MTRVNYKETEKLKGVIFNAYLHENNGKLNPIKASKLKLDIDEEWLKTILEGCDGEIIKVHNRDIIQGVIKMKVHEKGGDIFLLPESQYCILTEENLYSFY